ncbi:MAG: hypothetical protein LBV72_02955 [Tannerella sp.]|jgi:hypothetical protein|nr:hypothetical protein [Tannerella sp.]
MKGCHTKTLWGGIFSLFIIICFVSCEEATSSLLEIDENGNVSDNLDINIQKSLVDAGIKGYAIDSLYTEFVFTESKNPRIKTFRKGTATFEPNGKLKSIVFNKSEANIAYGEKLSYVCNGIKTEMVLNQYGFVEEKTSRYSDGSLHSLIYYRYDKVNGGYLNYVHLERPGEERVTIYYTYPDENGGLTIREGNSVYKIPMAKNKLSNDGYICNVFSHTKAPLTNQYVINPDLYYFGVYGTPIKYLPDVIMENGVTTENGIKKSVIVKIDDYRFFYN